ncbi:DUF2017 family protein [Ornithinimicrobium cryptoxanthini]|uniref:DUF2017 domain-containing protein n=1 Tax=Ornithinimicrobium cryptoxanthini TaxID=2934161 RepID=A0ABY4YF54_9MICO|nr:DUF2017 family protein [Ornithinimicrobium cryptoxanthini]USQ75229.1 DUF2017 domain-containing protein [Ornithinimicrobium cryptoxanthini]
MATMFRRREGLLTATWETAEVAVVLHLLQLTHDFVAPERESTGDPFMDLVAGLGGTADPEEPSDPALRRLLPAAHRTDAEQAAEFRRLTEHTLRSRKAANLATAITALSQALPDEGDHEPDEPVQLALDAGQARAMTMALTDIRLILGERLGMRTEEDSERLHEEFERVLQGEGEMDPATVQQMAYYDFLTWVQESLTGAMLG